jgi:hypothetical protein
MSKVEQALARNKKRTVRWSEHRSGVKVRCVGCTEMIGEDDQAAIKITMEGGRPVLYQAFHPACKRKKVQ